jgi:glycosyltransferase involved in cell wall biosynthesis
MMDDARENSLVPTAGDSGVRSGALRLIGITIGDPDSVSTYSGVPWHLFQELADSGHLVGRMDANLIHAIDLCRGVVDWRRTWAAKRPRRNAFWRYLPKNIERLSQRVRRIENSLPDHNAVIQFGVTGLPHPDKFLVAHVEMSVETAAGSTFFRKSYGFESKDAEILRQAIEGEEMFLRACDLVWTNSSWTAGALSRRGVPADKLWAHPPACCLPDPGTQDRNWEGLEILFVGKDWERKGGPLLVEAFRIVRQRFPKARLTVAGCSPRIHQDGVRILGFLDKQNPKDARLLHRCFQEATLFCMPTHWDTTGVVYMEAALYGLPVVMLKGQAREEIFPNDMAVHVDSASSQDLGDILIELAENPTQMQGMGSLGRQRIREQYTWPAFAGKLMGRVARLRNSPANP